MEPERSEGWAEKAGYKIGQRPNASATPPEKQPYKSHSEAKVARRVWIHLKNGERHIIEAWPIRAKSPRPDMLLIKCSTDAISIHGRNLLHVERALADGRLSALYEFNPDTDEEPEADEPKIFTIEIAEVKDMP